MSRRRPLHTCGASLLAVIHTACRKAQELNGPLGKWAKTITKCMTVVLPLIYVVQYQWLAILSFTDDCILTFEKLVETIFPPSTRIFDRIDKLVCTAEVMPGRFDEALNRFLVIMHGVPFLEWALIQIIWWLDGNHMEEKDIMIDMNSNTRSNVTESADNANCPSQELPSVYCPPQENIFEVGKPEGNAELPARAKSEKLVSVLDSMENEVKTDNVKYAVESSTINQSGDLISAPAVDSSQESVDHVQLPSMAASLDISSQDRRKSIDHTQSPTVAAPLGRSSKESRKSVDNIHLLSVAAPRGGSSQNRRKSVGHVEFPSTAAPPGNPFQDKSKSVDHVESPSIADTPGNSFQKKRVSVDHAQLQSTAKKEELPSNKILEDETSQDKIKSIDVKLESDIVKGAEKETFAKQTKADNTREKSQQSSVSEEKVERDKEKGTQKSINDEDPVLELFESRWHL